MPKLSPKGFVVTKTFKIYRSSETGEMLPGLDRDDPLEVTIKQASRKTVATRQEMYKDAIDNSITWDKDSEGKDKAKRTIKNPTQTYQENVDLWLTLTECNLQTEDGKPLFQFRGEGNDRRPDDTIGEFSNKLNLLPATWVSEMWDRVLFLNPDWGESAYMEDEVELTETQKK